MTAGPGTVAAFVAEPIVGATLAAAVPPDDYWPAIAEVCRRHGVLLIADEVMTGFGRTGRWFGVDHWGVRPDILVAAKGATSGYWPFGFVAASGEVHETVTRRPGSCTGSRTRTTPVGGGRRPRGAADPRGRGPRRRASATKGDRLQALLHDRSASTRAVGEIRGRGLMVGRRARRRTARPARLPESRALDRGDRRAARGSAGCSSTRARATPTASTATRSCSGRRS